MTNRIRYVVALLVAGTALAPVVSQAQESYAYNQTVAGAQYSQDQLDALLAPIALYPDQLLAQVLMAATYPLDVADAARFVKDNPTLKGDALDQALQGRNWDPSVLSLTAYPQVLLMMSDMPDWTAQLGQAFLANQQQVMDTVQMLRSRAQAQGNLQNTPQQVVTNQDGYIDIEPAQPQYVYVPVYDPRVIYGPWWDAAYLPAYWYPPAYFGYPVFAPGFFFGIAFGTGCEIWHNHWGWARPYWRGHDIRVDRGNNYFVNRPQYANQWRDGRWTHTPARAGYVYPASAQVRNNEGVNNQPREAPAVRGQSPSQPAFARPPLQVQQPVSRQPALPQPPLVHGVPQGRSPVARAVSQPQLAMASPFEHPPQPVARTTQPQSLPRVMPQPHQVTASPVMRPQQSVNRPDWQGQRPFASQMPQAQPRQSFVRPTPSIPQPSRPAVNAMPQRPAPQFAHNVQPPMAGGGHVQVNHVAMNLPEQHGRR